MAYEAMNNAGSMDSRLIVDPQRQRHVDRAAGRRDERLSVASAVVEILHVVAPSRRARWRAICPSALEACGAAGRGIGPQLRHRRHPVRGARLLLCRPDRRPQHRPSAAGSEECPRQQRNRAGPGPCRDREGPRLSVGRAGRRQVAQRRQVRRDHRRAGQIDARRRPPTPASSPNR